MNLTAEQTLLVGQLKAMGITGREHYAMDNKIDSEMCTPEFCGLLLTLDASLFMALPANALTAEMAKDAISRYCVFSDDSDFEMMYSDYVLNATMHLLDDADFLSFLIGKDVNIISRISKGYVNAEHYEQAAKILRVKRRTYAEILNHIPAEILTPEIIRNVLANCDYIEEKEYKYFDAEMLPYFVRNASPVLEYLPEFLSEKLTHEDFKVIFSKSQKFSLNLRTYDYTKEDLLYALENFNKKGFAKLYTRMKELDMVTPELVSDILERDLYSSELFDDLIATGKEFNPMKLYVSAMRASNQPAAFKRIEKTFTKEMIAGYFLSIMDDVTDKEYSLIVSRFKIDGLDEQRENKKVLSCGKCGNDLSEELMKHIRNGKIYVDADGNIAIKEG